MGPPWNSIFTIIILVIIFVIIFWIHYYKPSADVRIHPFSYKDFPDEIINENRIPTFLGLAKYPYSQFEDIQLHSPKYFPNEILKQYKHIKILGQGGFGTVYQFQSRSTGKMVAIKEIDRSSSAVETQLMKHFNHAHILRAFDDVPTHDKNYIIMEYMAGGNLDSRLEERGNLKDKIAKLYFYQICLGVQYLQKIGASHRDLKPDNILLACENDETLLKIADFGLSHCCFGLGYDGPGDILSLSTILLCLLGIKNRNSFSYKQRSLIESMRKEEPAERADINKVLGCSWLNDEKIKQTVKALKEKFN